MIRVSPTSHGMRTDTDTSPVGDFAECHIVRGSKVTPPVRRLDATDPRTTLATLLPPSSPEAVVARGPPGWPGIVIGGMTTSRPDSRYPAGTSRAGSNDTPGNARWFSASPRTSSGFSVPGDLLG